MARASVTTLFVGGSKTGEPGETFGLGQTYQKVLFFLSTVNLPLRSGTSARDRNWPQRPGICLVATRSLQSRTLLPARARAFQTGPASMRQAVQRFWCAAGWLSPWNHCLFVKNFARLPSAQVAGSSSSVTPLPPKV